MNSPKNIENVPVNSLQKVTYEYYPSFMTGVGEEDWKKFSLWNVPAAMKDMEYGLQIALGIGFARQLLDSYAINDNGGPSTDNDLCGIVQHMGIKTDGVQVGFFSELTEALVRYAKMTRQY
jgi:hypothetical protein